MIIICKECSTKFRLDESLLKGTGSQVRCSACKNIFTAYPPNVLGQTETPSQAQPAPQSYFDSEEELGGGYQKAVPDDDDDGLELDVEEEDEDMADEGLDLGDDDSGFDDAGIEMGNKMSGTDTGMNFDEDMDVEGIPNVDFGTDSGSGDLDLEDTAININLDQGENIELDPETDLKNNSDEPGIVLPDLDPVAVTDESSSTDEDFEFEFECSWLKNGKYKKEIFLQTELENHDVKAKNDIQKLFKIIRTGRYTDWRFSKRYW